MTWPLLSLLFWIACPWPAQAQAPAIARSGIRNEASLLPATNWQGYLAPGAKIVIRGIRFGSSKSAVQVLLDKAQSQVESVTAERIVARLPHNLKPGAYNLTVRTAAGVSAGAKVQIAANAAGLYSRNGLGWGQGQVRNLDTGSAITFAQSVKPGQRIAVRATGASNRILVAGKEVTAQPLQDELRFTLPLDTPSGCFVPITATNTVTVAVRGTGGSCEPKPDFPFGLWTASRASILLLYRMVFRDLDAASESTRDEVAAEFLAMKQDGRFPGPLLHDPPEGYCSSYLGDLDPNTGTQLLPMLFGGSASGDGLDAGPDLAINNSATQRRIPPRVGVEGLYQALLGGDRDTVTRRLGLNLFLNSGRFVVHGRGGKDVGPFESAMIAPVSFSLSDRDKLSAWQRGKPVSLVWNGSEAPTRMMIVAGSQDADTGVAGFCQCMAKFAMGRFTIPEHFVNRLPGQKGMIWLITWPLARTIPISKDLNQSAAISLYSHRQEFRFLP